MWRQFSQWLGGIGIIVLALAVLPRLRVGGRQLLEHEMPGPEIESLSTRIRDTARRVWILYIALTVVLLGIFLTLWATGIDEEMSPFHAFAHAFTTIPTAGFSTKVNSIEAFAPATQWVVIVFMVLGGINFALMYRAIVRRQPRLASRDQELRLYVSLLAARLDRRRSPRSGRRTSLSGWPRGPGRDLHGRLDDDDDRASRSRTTTPGRRSR